MNVTSDGKYFISNKITLSGSDNITDKKATITVSGVNGAFVTKDANATSGTNTFTFGDKIYIIRIISVSTRGKCKSIIRNQNNSTRKLY